MHWICKVIVLSLSVAIQTIGCTVSAFAAQAPLHLQHFHGHLRDGVLLPDGKGIIVGSFGILMRTTDYGTTWTQPYTGVPLDIQAITRTGEGTYLTACDSGGINRSTNDGISWHRVYVHTKDSLIAIASNGRSCIVVGFSGALYHSDDDGISWKEYTDVPAMPYITIATQNGRWFVGTNDGRVAISNDNTATWHVNTLSNGGEVKAIALYQDYTAVIVASELQLYENGKWRRTRTIPGILDIIWKPATGSNKPLLFGSNAEKGPCILNTADGTVTMLPVIRDTTFVYSGYIYGHTRFFDNINGLTFGVDKTIWRSNNEGMSWYGVCSMPGKISVMHFANDSMGWIGAGFIRIYRTTNGGITWHPREPFAQQVLNGQAVMSLHSWQDTNVLATVHANLFYALRSTDAGKTFQRASQFPHQTPYNIKQQKLFEVYVVGSVAKVKGIEYQLFRYSADKEHNELLRTTKDSIITGDIVTLGDSTTLIREVIFHSNDSIQCNILRSIDNGTTFSPVHGLPSQLMNRDGGRIYSWSNNHALFQTLLPNDSVVFYRSSNAGETWVPTSVPIIKFNLTYNEVTKILTIVDANLTVFTSADNGLTWEQVNTDSEKDTKNKWQFIQATENRVWLRGMANEKIPNPGTYLIARPVSDEEITKVDEDRDFLPPGLIPYKVLPPYPNPFTTTISIPLAFYARLVSTVTSVKIHDITGRMVKDLTPSLLSAAPPKEITLQWQPNDDLLSGVYYIVVRNGYHTSVTPLIYIRQ